jgi:hypothetical protein
LASLTRFHPLLFRQGLAATAVLQLHIGQTTRASQREGSSQNQQGQRATTDTGLCLQLGLHFFQIAAQRFAVGNDGVLGFTRGHQALQVAQNGAGLNASLFIHLDQRIQLLTRGGILGGRQAQLGTAREQTLGDFLEGIQVLAQQKHGLGAHAFGGQELVGGLADTLG